MNIYDIIKKEFGTNRVTVTPTKKIPFTTSETLVLRANAQRAWYMIINPTANDAFVNFATGVSSTNGIRIQNSGGYIMLSVMDDMNLVAEELYGIINTASADLVYAEIEVY